jgi:hypothetical protein
VLQALHAPILRIREAIVLTEFLAPKHQSIAFGSMLLLEAQWKAISDVGQDEICTGTSLGGR